MLRTANDLDLRVVEGGCVRFDGVEARLMCSLTDAEIGALWRTQAALPHQGGGQRSGRECCALDGRGCSCCASESPAVEALLALGLADQDRGQAGHHPRAPMAVLVSEVMCRWPAREEEVVIWDELLKLVCF